MKKQLVMRKQILLFFVPVLLCCFSCKNRTKDNVTIPVIDIEYAMEHLYGKKMNFSEFVDSISYVALETNVSCVIENGIFTTLNISANHIFHGTMVFSRDGRFVKALGKVGQGPGEYTLALDSKADEKRREFYVYSNDSRKIFIYDFDNQFIRNVPGRYPGFRGFLLLENGNILLERDTWVNSENLYEYQVVENKTGAILYKRENVAINKDHKEMIANCFWRYDNTLYYFENLTDTIFRLNKNGEIISPRFVIKLGKYGIRDKDSKSKSDNKLLKIGQIVECSEYMFFSIVFKQSGLYYAAYNKKTGELRINKYDRFFNNDIDGGFLWLFNEAKDSKLGFNDVLPYLAKKRIDLLSSQSSGYDKDKNQKLKHFINELEEDDNNIYYFFHLK